MFHPFFNYAHSSPVLPNFTQYVTECWIYFMPTPMRHTASPVCDPGEREAQGALMASAPGSSCPAQISCAGAPRQHELEAGGCHSCGTHPVWFRGQRRRRLVALMSHLMKTLEFATSLASRWMTLVFLLKYRIGTNNLSMFSNLFQATTCHLDIM